MNKNILRKMSIILVILGGLIGFTTLLGYVMNIENLIAPWLGQQKMVPNTSLGITLLGFSMVIQSQAKLFFYRRLLGILSALGALFIGALTLVESITQIDFGIWTKLHIPASSTSFCLTLLSLISFSLCSKKIWILYASNYMALIVTAITWINLGIYIFALGYLFSIDLFQFSPNAMAFSTALALFALAIGSIGLRPDVGIARTFSESEPGSRLLRWLSPLFICSPLLMGILMRILMIKYEMPKEQLIGLSFLATTLFSIILVWFLAKAINEETRKLKIAHKTEKSLRRRVETLSEAHAHILDTLSEIPKKGVELILQTFLLQARIITSAEMGAIGIGSRPDKPFDPWIVNGVPEDLLEKIGRIPHPVGILGLAALHNQTLRLKDASVHPSMGKLPPGHPSIQSFMAIPLIFKEECLGTLYLANKQGDSEFTEEDETIIKLLGSRVVSALETARRYSKSEMEQAWLNDVINQIPQAVLIYNEYGKLTHFNRIAQSFFLKEVHPDSIHLKNSTFLDIRTSSGEPVPWEQAPHVRATLKREILRDAEYIIRMPGGRQASVLISASPIRGIQSEFGGAVLIFKDITQFKQQEKEREEWISIIAHDLRQPVTTILLTADFLKKSFLDVQTSGLTHIPKALDRIKSSSTKLDGMIRDLLDASRLEAKRLQINKRITDLARLLEELVARYEHDFVENRFSLKILTRPPLFVSIDPLRIEQVMENLLSNAIKYSTPHTLIEISLHANKDNASISVSNTGPGIPEEAMPYLFQRFFRVAEIEKKASGIGLGLYICKALIEAHRGRIKVESIPGGKTTFTFSLPLPKEKEYAA